MGWDPGESIAGKRFCISVLTITHSYRLWDTQFREVEGIGTEHALD